ncbi:protein FAM110B [Trichomycterus rosablanca]|uniref:protein FAM110B n=1 Tax=Trichomycterus rosablanca TaxID=2290929 RepID=UPI002F3590D1
MSIDTLGPSVRRLVRPPESTDSSTGQRKPSAVERLEADKAKYVKSQQVALNRQLPIIRKPLVPPCNSAQLRPGAPQPTRKVARSSEKPDTSVLYLEHLNSLINGVSDPLVPSTPAHPQRAEKSVDSAGFNPSQLPSPTESALKSVSSPITQGKSTVDGLASTSTATVRRVDVRPQVALPQMRRPCRMQLPEQRLHSQLLQLLRPYTHAQPSPLLLQPTVKPPNNPVQPLPASAEPLSQALPPSESPAEQVSPSHNAIPPPSPAVTNRSSVTSKKRRSLTRSKSDVSDRFSRAGADVERFFNYCGLEPTDFSDLAPGSDIASLSRLRSASAPASEHTADGNEEEEEEAAKEEKPSYGISVIERNARVIKWLYELRQVKDSTKVANI